jgi:hypothetical protein
MPAVAIKTVAGIVLYLFKHRYILGDFPLIAPAIKDITSNTIKMKKIILAIPAAAPAIPPKPNTPAINAITKKVKAHPNIVAP